MEELEGHFKTGKIKFFYTIPRFHYPLGHSYSEQDKLSILNLAAKYDVYIVEDDYLGDLDSKKGQTFHYLDTEEHVIYIKSFSTSLFLPFVLQHSFFQMLSKKHLWPTKIS